MSQNDKPTTREGNASPRENPYRGPTPPRSSGPHSVVRAELRRVAEFDPPTERQLQFLARHGLPVTGIPREQATVLIGQIKREEVARERARWAAANRPAQTPKKEITVQEIMASRAAADWPSDEARYEAFRW